ncbi:hypothetical protein TB1_016688 [Malus domestica]|uniref:Uncharacterized protein n=1 Tax=Malus domestica TaxID=3750 RepID=A0A498HXF8_MALDO|nr:hypothetical protein DVH24_028968 [Malus domestica]
MVSKPIPGRKCADEDVRPLPSTRPFGSSLASGSVGTPKLSEKEDRALPGLVTHWEVAREFPKNKTVKEW